MNITAYYERCPQGPYRWWLDNNPGDVFDIISKEQLDERIKAAASLGIRVVDHLPGFCTDPLCTDHPLDRTTIDEAFKPGIHCPNCKARGFLRALPTVRFKDFPYACSYCITDIRGWKSRSNRAKKAVATKREKYPRWPGGRKPHPGTR